MSINTHETVWIQRRVKASGVPFEIAQPILSLFLTWCEKSGIEWSITRFKAIKNDFVRRAAGLEPCSTWVKKSHYSTKHIFGGVLGTLEIWCFKDVEKHLTPTLSLLNIYTNFYAEEPTKAQKQKFLTAVQAPLVRIPEAVERGVLQGMSRIGLRPRRKLQKATPLLTYNPSDTKWAPTPFGRKTEEMGVIDSVGYLCSPAGQRHYQKYRQYYDPVLDGLESEIMLGRNFVPLAYPLDKPTVGRIGFIQEAGFKLRAVANPGRIFQQVLSPLGDSLFQILRELPWDCTFEQSKADEHLKLITAEHSKVIRSVDLSNATDYFPLDLQVMVLNALFPQDLGLVSLFHEVSRSYWDCNLPWSDLEEYGFSNPGKLSWNKGQPLGLYPSFASFALTHGLLLYSLLESEWDKQFFILGDDVVILDDELYERYIRTLGILACPVSSQKTLSSPNLAEFHSTIYFHGRMVPSYKWRKPSDDSFLDLLKNVGPRLIPLLTPRQRRVVDGIAALPEELGGLGWNPKGLPLSERMDPWMSYLLRDKPGLEHLTDYSGHLARLLWQSELSKLTRKVNMSMETDMSHFDTFDLKVVELVRASLGASLVPMRAILGLNLGKVVDYVDLPIPGVRRFTKESNLTKWERVIKRTRPDLS